MYTIMANMLLLLEVDSAHVVVFYSVSFNISYCIVNLLQRIL